MTADTANKPNQICADLSTAASIRTSFNISATNPNVAKMVGCGLAVLNLRYTNRTATTPIFNNLLWGTDGSSLAADN